MAKAKRTSEELDFIHAHGLSLKTRELFLHGALVEQDDPGVDYRMANVFMKNLRILEHDSLDPIVIYQYSIGGEWSAGIAVYDMIKHSKCSFIFVCCGTASSMGSIIPQSVVGKGIRLCYPTCDWLVHQGSGGGFGTTKQVAAISHYYDYINSHMLNIYANACSTGDFFSGKTRSQIKKYISQKMDSKEDWYFDSGEALSMGFVDGIYGHGDFTDIDTVKGML